MYSVRCGAQALRIQQKGAFLEPELTAGPLRPHGADTSLSGLICKAETAKTRELSLRLVKRLKLRLAKNLQIPE